MGETIETVVFGNEFVFNTDPGLFSPRQIDRGTRAMLDLVTLAPEDELLDLGCGYGVVGLGAARVLGEDRVVLVDNDPVAVRVSRDNARQNGLPGVTILQGDGPAVCERSFSLILCNPPYHTDFQVARRFLEQGYRQLDEGGRFWLVVKRLTWYRNKMRQTFGGVRVIRQDGYFVLMAQKRQRDMKKDPSLGRKSTRKHEKKQRRTAQKKHRPL